ncbi:MAG: hypothetical protein FJ291_26545 [Planctomycetes bacterium]|nr:hypothetical protein [Planctomycetota bacterium]
MVSPPFLVAALAAAVAFGQGAPGEWQNCLDAPARLTAPASGETRHTDGTLDVSAAGRERAIAVLAPSCPPSFDLQVELLWTPPRGKGGGVKLLAGPHAFGSAGYQVVASSGPWGAAECRAPRIEPGQWQSVELRVRPGHLEYWLAGALVARCPAGASAGAGVRLAVEPGTRASVRLCRLRVPEDDAAEAPPRFVYPAAAFRHLGRAVPDGLASGGRAVELAGAGRDKWLLGGHDAVLGVSGQCVAAFGLRGIEGAGNVWLEVARADGQALASSVTRLEELPTRAYARLRLPFRCEAGAVLEFRVAAERGRLRVDEVAVDGIGEVPAGADARPRSRERQALPLAEAWGKARPDPQAPAAIVRLERRLAEGGWYEFRALWQHNAQQPLDGLAVDLWVACRDAWGIVRVFDFGAAYDATPPGPQETAAWLDPALLPRYGPPVALFAQLYRKGAPLASASRKWGIPVADNYIIEAQRSGPLAKARATEERGPLSR